MRTVAVVDIGKTSAKVALVDLETLSETLIARTANAVSRGEPYSHFDIERLWRFIIDGLTEAVRRGPPDAISVATHGVAAALLDADGGLVMPMLDYEDASPERSSDAYDGLRPPFSETGTPRLPNGLNLAAQLFWQQKAFPEVFARVRSIVPYPQYWAWRLTGVLSTEVTSLGCHTDLWNPGAGAYSSLVDAMDWRRLMPPLRRACDVLGPVEKEIAIRCGLQTDTPVVCGIHDSNASLYPHLLARAKPFAVVSTGTWVIVMAVAGKAKPLDAARDTLINVNAFGEPVPSSRFMGGREFASLLGGSPVQPTEADIARVLATPCLLTPSAEHGSGPFPGRIAEWLPSDDLTAGERFAVVSFYLAMMTATCLDLTGACGDIVVEGPFASNACFSTMLATAAGRDVIVSESSTGTSIGAALLCVPVEPRPDARRTEVRFAPDADWAAYAKAWRDATGQ